MSLSAPQGEPGARIRPRQEHSGQPLPPPVEKHPVASETNEPAGQHPA